MSHVLVCQKLEQTTINSSAATEIQDADSSYNSLPTKSWAEITIFFCATENQDAGFFEKKFAPKSWADYYLLTYTLQWCCDQGAIMLALSRCHFMMKKEDDALILCEWHSKGYDCTCFMSSSDVLSHQAWNEMFSCLAAAPEESVTTGETSSWSDGLPPPWMLPAELRLSSHWRMSLNTRLISSSDSPNVKLCHIPGYSLISLSGLLADL